MVRALVGKVIEAVSGMMERRASEEVQLFQDGREMLAGIGMLLGRGMEAGRGDHTNAAVTSHELMKLFEKVMPGEVIDEMAGQEGVSAIVTGAHDRLRGIMINRIKEAFSDKVQEEYGFYEYILSRSGKSGKREVTRIQSQKDLSLDKPEGQKVLLKELEKAGVDNLNVPGVEFKVKGGVSREEDKGAEKGKGLTKKKVKSVGISVPIGTEGKKEEYELVKRRGKIFDPTEVNLMGAVSDVELDDKIDDQIGKMFDYYRKNPDRFVKMLVKVKGGLKEKGEIKGPRKGLEETSPVVSAYLYPKTNKKLEEQAIGDNETIEKMSDRGRMQIVDVGALSAFKSLLGKDVEWYMTGHGIKKGDRIGMKVRFKGVPGLTEEYAIEIPSMVGDIKDRGEKEPYHFRVLDVGEDGVLLQFVEQSKERGEDWVGRIRESGVTEGELNEMVKDMAVYYTNTVFRKMDAPDMIEEMGGEVAVAGTVASPTSLGQVIGDLTKREEGVSQGEEEGVLPGYKGRKIEEEGKGDKALGVTPEEQEIGGMLSRSDYMSKMRPLIETIAGHFPERAVFSPTDIRSVGLEAALTTRSMIRWILTIMADEALELSKSGTVPWKTLVRDVIQDRSGMLLDPEQMKKYFSASHLNDLFKALKIVAAKDSGVPNEEVLQMVDLYHQGKLPLTPEDRQGVLEYLKKVSTSGEGWRKSNLLRHMESLQKELQQAVLDLSKTDSDVARLMEQSRIRGELSRGSGGQYEEVKRYYEGKEKELTSALKAADGHEIIRILGRDLYDDLVGRKLLPDVEDPSELDSYKGFDASEVRKLIEDVLTEYRKAYAPKLDRYKAMTYPQIQKSIQEGDKSLSDFQRQRMLRVKEDKKQKEETVKMASGIYHDMMREYISSGAGGDRDLNEMAVRLVSRRFLSA